MPKFRKRPVVIEAEQFIPDSLPWPEGVYGEGSDRWFIDSLEGKMSVVPSAWIITGVEGERYSCDPAIFAQTYERVEEGA